MAFPLFDLPLSDPDMIPRDLMTIHGKPRNTGMLAGCRAPGNYSHVNLGSLTGRESLEKKGGGVSFGV